MKYELIEKSWSKRRKLDEKSQVSHIEFIDFKKEHNHFCKLQVTYEDGSSQSYVSRVIYNEIKQQWIVDGMHIAVRLIE